jgi:hypothetical protein
MPRPINQWIVLIPGFMQTMGQSHQGVPALWHQLWDKFKDRGIRGTPIGATLRRPFFVAE